MRERADDRFAMLSRRYRPALISFFVRRVHSQAEAEDLTQEVLIRLLELSNQQVANTPAYIFKIATNLVRDRARRQSVRDNWVAELLAGDELQEVDWQDPQRLLQGRETLKRVAAALGELSERTRDILLLFRLERMRKRDIAESMGISVSAVDKHLIRATAHLTRRLEEEP